MKTTRRKLIVAFKEFQRLPEWAVVIKLAHRQSSSHHQEGRNSTVAAPRAEDGLRAQAFAE